MGVQSPRGVQTRAGTLYLHSKNIVHADIHSVSVIKGSCSTLTQNLREMYSSMTMVMLC